MLISDRAAIESILLHGITSWSSLKLKIFNLVKTAGKLVGTPTPLTPQDIFEQSTLWQADGFLSDPSRVSNSEYVPYILWYVLMNSGRTYMVPQCKHNCDKHSFVNPSFELVNGQLLQDGQNSRGGSKITAGFIHCVCVYMFVKEDVCYRQGNVCNCVTI